MTKVNAFVEGVLSVLAIVPTSTTTAQPHFVRPQAFNPTVVEAVNNKTAWRNLANGLHKNYIDGTCRLSEEEKKKLGHA